jgi:hypothetical protein
MSLFDYMRHDQQAHAPHSVYRLADGATVCCACFLESLSDPSVLAGRRHYALRCADTALAACLGEGDWY